MTPINCHTARHHGTMRAGAEHTVTSVLSPHDSGALPCQKFKVLGWVSRIRKVRGEACYSCSTTQPTRYSLNTVPSGFQFNKERETMTTVTQLASHCAAPNAQATPTEEARAFALLQASSDATMARLYLSKGNVAAARRKAVQLLKALQVLEVSQ